MAVRDLPGIGLTAGYAAGAGGWGDAMNGNLLKQSVLTQLVVASTTAPIGTVLLANGDVTLVPVGSGADSNKIAFMDEGIYKYIVPKIGWKAHVKDLNATAIWTGTEWFIDPYPVDAYGATFTPFVKSQIVDMTGAEVITTIAIPLVGMVIAVPVHVTQAIVGTATGFNVGIVGAATQYGGPIAKAVGTKNVGQTYSPVTYNYGGPIPIRLAAVGGTFTSGKVKVTIMGFDIKIP